MAGIPKEQFLKSLQRLENMARAQQVTKSQLFHTGSDSQPGTWAGSAPSDEDENTSLIDINGTDYDGVKKSLAAKVSKSKALTQAEVALVKGFNPLTLIASKVATGGKLTKAEKWAINGGRKIVKSLPIFKSENEKPHDAGTPGDEKDAATVPGTNAGQELPSGELEGDAAKGMPPFMKDDDKDDDDAKKSLQKAVETSETLQKGIEMSPFLYEFLRAMDTALEGTEARVQKGLAKSLAPVVAKIAALETNWAKSYSEIGEFNKSLAEAVLGIGQQLAGQAEVVSQVIQTPAHAPKSQLRSVPSGVQVLNKSFGPGGLDTSDNAFTKSQITNIMTDMVKSNQLSAIEVVKYETTGEISPSVQQRVTAYAGSQRNGR